MELLMEDDSEYLASLEQRILRAVEIVAALKKENETLKEKLNAALSGRSDVEGEAASLRAEIASLRKEADSLRGERKQVRTRIEKLLGQMDLLGA